MVFFCLGAAQLPQTLRGLINKLHTGEKGRTLQLRLEHRIIIMYEMAPATTTPARALAVPGEAHRAGPHLAQALDDVLVRQVVAARLRVAVLATAATLGVRVVADQSRPRTST